MAASPFRETAMRLALLALPLMLALVAAPASAQIPSAGGMRLAQADQPDTPPAGEPEGDDAPATADPGQSRSSSPAGNPVKGANGLPEVYYGDAALPEPVRALRQRLLEAAATGDLETLRPILEQGDQRPVVSVGEGQTDPLDFLKSQSGDPDGREILAILEEVLQAGYVHLDPGTPQEAYVWPYFAAYPLDRLTPPQMVELFKIITGQDFADMKEYGAYVFFRVGISPDGVWHFFISGD
jgi:hypothetical protein